MPTYTYECQSCKHRFDQYQSISEKPLTTCPKCKEETVNRLITSGNFVLKGEGWFKTSGSY